MSEFAPVLNVSTLNGTNGFRLDGDAAGDRSGFATTGGGDVNGDGFADLLIGAPISDTGGVARGLAWVVFGAASSLAAQGLAARVAAGSAYRFQGEAAVDQAGYSIANAGDVNGDGFDDLIIGARGADPDAVAGDRGASYLVFGGAANLEAADAADAANDNLIALAALTPATGFRFDGGANFDFSGWSVSGAGDINGDGIADLLIGAPLAAPNGGTNEGASTIVFGGTANLGDLDDDDGIADGRIDLAQISAGQGLRLDGATTFAGDRSGKSVALLGDVNGDGFDDVLVGANYADPNGVNNNEGAAYLIFGKPQAQFALDDGDGNADGTLDLAGLTGLAGTRFDGVAAGDYAGQAFNGLGDVNGDGFADIAIGAPFADSSGNNSGSAYVVFGKSAFGASSDLSALNGANGFRLDGLRASDYTGVSVSAAGDVNGDGFADMLISVSHFDRPGATNAGAAHVVFGKASGFSAVVDLGALDGDSGFRIEGAAGGDGLGLGTAGAAGDVNGDGFDDIVVGAKYADNGAGDSGSAYIVYGHRAETAVIRVGTALGNKMNGGKGDDAISGLSGNDTLIGWEGDDTINGGDGNDVINDGAGNDTINAGSGRDSILITSGDDIVNGGSDKDLLDCRTLTGAVNINLGNGTFVHPNGEDLITLVSIEDVRGSSFNDTIVGGLAANYLIGFAGNDTLDGGNSADLIEGGVGKDTMTGGSASDRFIFRSVTESGTTAGTRDIVTDFTVNPAVSTAFIDRLDLNVIDAQAGTAGAQAFSFIGAGAFTAEGQVRAFQSGADTIVEINTTGATGAEMTIQLSNFIVANLTAADFIL